MTGLVSTLVVHAAVRAPRPQRCEDAGARTAARTTSKLACSADRCSTSPQPQPQPDSNHGHNLQMFREVR